MKQQTIVDASTTQQFSVLIRKFLALVAEIHRAEVSPAMIAAYESALSDVPVDEMRAALVETLRHVEYWPTPGHIRKQLERHRNEEG